MPKSKSRKSSKNPSGGGGAKYGANIGQTSGKTNKTIGVAAAVLAIAAGAFWWNSNQASNESQAAVEQLAAEGSAILAQVRAIPAQGNEHLGIGAVKRYVEPFPTSGDHASSGVKAGFYTNDLPKVNLVHNLEHGNIVIYYETPGDAALEALREWGSLYRGAWDGVVVTASPGLGDVVVMTAWTKLLRLEQFDAGDAAAFLDAYRGRGPENQVR
ncbi:MAG: hypothetical protein COB40_13265 [Marinosulfonomonas sp.]|nr:MAG: hypothetical protein COB40_13265 [Marinosulfonomonas sp.]